MGEVMDKQFEVKLSLTSNVVFVSFQTKDNAKFQNTLGEFRRVCPKARWDASKRAWILPLSNLDNLFNFLHNAFGNEYSHQLRLL